MKSKLQACRAVFLAAAALMLTLPGALLLVPQLRQKDTSGAENRNLAEFPTWTQEDGRRNPEFFSQAERWFSEHFALRPQMVSAYSTLTRTVFGVSAAEDVIIGREGWLYYAPTAADITGLRTRSDTEIQHMAHTLSMMRDHCEANGAAFIFAPAPDKGSIYPQYLPARYFHSGGQNDLDALCAALEPTGVTLCDCRGALREAAGERQLYHKLDTHWNGDGAMLGYQTLMQTAGLDDRGFADYPRTETQDFAGDLWGMLAPDTPNPDANAVYAVPQTYRAVGRIRDLDDMTIRTSCAKGSGSLLMFRDSFGRALIPLLSECFASCTYSRANAVPLDAVAPGKNTLVVYELVERNLANLLTYAPCMPAPAAELPALSNANAAADEAKFRFCAENAGSYLHLYGLYDPAYADCTRLLLVTEAGACLEAFPCCEADKLDLDGPAANGFSLRIPAGTTGRVTLYAEQNGQAVLLGTGELPA